MQINLSGNERAQVSIVDLFSKFDFLCSSVNESLTEQCMLHNVTTHENARWRTNKLPLYDALVPPTNEWVSSKATLQRIGKIMT